MRLVKKYQSTKITVLNFFSATRPCGGVLSGRSAQEESLCGCSTLYSTLDQRFLWQNYYDVNCIAGNVLRTDAYICFLDIVIYKTDNYPENMPQEDWSWRRDSIRSAQSMKYTRQSVQLENGRAVGISPANLQRLHERHARVIFAVAVDTSALGVIGCGASCSDPKIVTRAYANVWKDCYRHFDRIEFTIFCWDFESENLIFNCHYTTERVLSKANGLYAIT